MSQPPLDEPRPGQPVDWTPSGEPVRPAQPRRGWFGRNWFWAVPVGCLVPFVCCCGGPLLLGYFAMLSIKSSEPYKEAVARAQESKAVEDALGTPIQVSFVVQGTINVTNDGGDADLTIPLFGPKGAGVLHVVGTKAAG